MKTWMLALSLLAVLGFTTMADAKGKGKHGIKGKIASVDKDKGTFTITTHAHKNKNGAAPATAPAGGETLTVHYTAGTTLVNGAAGKVDETMIGKVATIEGTKTGTDVAATSITVTDKGKGKKNKAA